VLLLFSSVVGLGLCELYLRATHYSEGIRLTEFVEHDPLLGWRHVPNYSGQYAGSEFRTPVHYNASGWRDSERPYTKPQNMPRIVVLGDSFAEGFPVPSEDRFGEVLAASLGAQVVNLGVTGYSTDQELLVLENQGWKYQPDIVVLEFYYNDVWANGSPRIAYGGMAKPMFAVDGAGNLTLQNVPVPKPRQPRWRLRLLDLVRSVVKQRLTARHAAEPRNPAVKSEPPEQMPEDFVAYRRAAAPQLKNAWAVTQAILRRMKQETAQHGARLLVFYVPSRVELSPDEWQKWHFPPEYAPREVAAKITAICADEGIPYIDLSENFHQAVATLYYAKDQHWTAAGHRLAGGILAGYLTHLGWRP
jgi:hypothetical protein